ncbi:MAG: leucyl/phenylalanyl-tRNA--protein transferase [Caulobacteraceae bacterium]|nr:leucyl/phenylalanyl-tRNA--protein transferase [Caulobacteraceae bacterium]
MTAFSLEDLIECYARGVFPMAETRDDERVFLVDPELRGVLPLDRFHASQRLCRTVRSDRFEVRIDTAFEQVLDECAAERPRREDTWINPAIRGMYQGLFARGLAHSVECWRDGTLEGGLYGVALGGAFFGESMFPNARDASKVALVHLVGRLRAGGYRLLDAQFLTAHLVQFGAVEVPRRDYHRLLEAALAVEGDFFALGPRASGSQALQAMTQAS